MNYDIERLKESGQINDYFYDKLKKSWLFMNSDLHDDFGEFMSDVMLMSKLGVSSKEDELHFRRIQHDVPDIIHEISSDDFQVTDYYMDALISELYNNRDKYDMSDLLSIFCSVAKAAQYVGIPLSDRANESCFIDKQAYPNNQGGSYIKQTYDISKWIDATKDIYSRIYRFGRPYSEAFEQVTANWDKMETLNYKHWLRFYTEGVPAKYPKLAGHFGKSAQSYVSDSGNYFPLPTASLLERPREEGPEEKPKPDENEVRDRIESQRNRIISRLSAAEKLLTSLEGQQFAGDEQEFMLKLLQDLKRKVQTANKLSVHSSLFEDFIYRAANYMQVKGSTKGRVFFNKVAQFGEIDPFAGAAPVGKPVGVSVQPTETTGDPVEDTRKAFREMREMSENLDESGILFYDSDDDPDERAEKRKEMREQQKPAPAQAPAPQAAPVPEVSQAIPKAPATGDISLPGTEPTEMPKAASNKLAVWAIREASSIINQFSSIVVTAQAAPVMPEEEMSIGEAEVAPPQDKPSRQRDIPEPDFKEQDITVTEDEPAVGLEDETGDIIDKALEHVTIHDAINLLEMLVSIYQQREVPRQLSKLDIVMDHLGLAAYFPQLGEAQTKALDVTQYVSTRLEDMLAKLKGSVESSEANSWVEKKREVDPDTKAVQQDLQAKQKKEEEKKELRKQKADEKLTGGDKKEVGQQAEQELGGPTAVETGTPVQVR